MYHALGNNAERYTPVSMVYTMAQLDYPVQNMLDKVWGLWVDDVGAETKLASILSFSDCGMIIGNPWCDPARCANGIFVQFFHRWKPGMKICQDRLGTTIKKPTERKAVFAAAKVLSMSRIRLASSATRRGKRKALPPPLLLLLPLLPPLLPLLLLLLLLLLLPLAAMPCHIVLAYENRSSAKTGSGQTQV